MTEIHFDALVTNLDPKRAAKAGGLSARLTRLDVETGEFEGAVNSSDPKHAPYTCRIQAKAKTMRCTCVDFERNLHACKHLIAFSRVCKMAVHGIHLDA